jgi:GT2 family glycosyltransferase
LSQPTLSVVILNWNGRAYLEACLAALAAQELPPDRVVLVDNGSTDDSVGFTRERFPWVTIRENGGNLGFAAGNNTALRDETAEVIVLLNPDVVLAPGALSALAGALADPSAGVVGTKLCYPDGETIQHAGGFITQPQALPGHYGIGHPDEGNFDVPRDVEYVIGAAAAFRRSLLDEIGLLDEGYFLYFEDVDFCARARNAGYRVVYWPLATGIHVESATAVKGSFAYLHRFHTGRWRYLLKHFPAAEIIEETFPAEMAWLGHLAPAERRAASLAYLSTQRQLAQILEARTREGAGALVPEETEAITAGLAELRRQTQRAILDAGSLDRLATTAELRVRPFTSDVPLIGPFIAWFRTEWNNIASRWYLDHLMVQQNEFNRLAVAEMKRLETELSEQMVLLEEQVVISAELREQIERLQAQLAELKSRAALHA